MSLEELAGWLVGTEPKMSTLPLELGAGAIGLAVGGVLATGLPPGTTIFPLQCGHCTVLPALAFNTRHAFPQLEQATKSVSGLLAGVAGALLLLGGVEDALAAGVAGFGAAGLGGIDAAGFGGVTGAAEAFAAGTSLIA
jgi:hypothetical protein